VKNPHFGKDPVRVGGIYVLRDADGKRMHKTCKLREVTAGDLGCGEKDGYVRCGVSFEARDFEPQDSDGFSLEVCCWAFPCDLRAKKLLELEQRRV
jgi:hypothetical protein